MDIKKALSVTAANAVRTLASPITDFKDLPANDAHAYFSAGGKADRYCSAKAYVKSSPHYS